MYRPSPINTSKIKLPKELDALMERLAENNHEIWAQQRLKDGWTYGPKRNDEREQHPDLVPYDQLPESERKYDRNSARGTIKAIISLGFNLQKKL